MKHRIFKSVFFSIMALVMTISAAGASLTPTSATTPTAASNTVNQQGTAVIKDKDEVIYARLSAVGEAQSVYAVNHFVLSKVGSVVDYGSYATVKNLTNTEPVSYNDETVSFQTDSNNFYFQGDLSEIDLPWEFELSYYLDGVKTQPQDIAGKSGALEIRLSTSKNGKINSTFYDHYLLQISMTLDTDGCENIEASGATLANAGKNKMITYTVMPKSNANIKVTADVKDFAMSGIEISAVPYSMNIEIPDTSGLVGDLTKLSDAISGLNDGIGTLANGTAEMRVGAAKLKSGSSDFKGGLAELNASSTKLTAASSQIQTALSQIAESLNNSGNSTNQIDLGDLALLPQGLSQLSKGLVEISGGLNELKKGFSPAYAALDQAIEGIPKEPIAQDQIQTLYSKTEQSQYDLLDRLVDSYKAGQTVLGTYNQVKAAFNAVDSTISTLTASLDTISGTLDNMSIQIESALSESDMLTQLKQLSQGLSQLSDNYGGFHSGLTAYAKGVGELSSGYASLDYGVSSMSDGIGNLSDGVETLHDGSSRLRDETKDMPNLIQSGMNDMISQYSGEEFAPVSFVSDKNKNTSFVQFVFKTAAIEKPEAKKVTPATTKPLSFWDRLVSLFRK